MKSIFWFLFGSSPKKQAARHISYLYAHIEGIKQQQKSRRKAKELENEINKLKEL